MIRTVPLSIAVTLCLLAFGAAGAAAAPNLSITAEPYLTGGLFTNPVLPMEDQEVTITLRASCSEGLPASPAATLIIAGPGGDVLVSETLTLTQDGDTATAAYTWSQEQNGLYTVKAALDPENTVAESDESDNEAELVLPVIVKGKGRQLHFPWYRESPAVRWTTCVTSAGSDEGQVERLAERGVLPLTWAPARTVGYDKEQAKTDPDAVLADIEETLFRRYSAESTPHGCGIDEVGAYPATFGFDANVAALNAMIRTREAKPERFIAVWFCGGTRPHLAALARRCADLVMLETYLWRALPEELGAYDIYEAMACRVDPIIRATDMFQPAYGNRCFTLLALDTTERPDRTDPGELEQVVRFIRSRWPEMRGIAWYNGSTRMEKTEENLRTLDDTQLAADRLCFAYWVKPCITLLQNSLWLTANRDGSHTLNLAVNNLGSIDSKAVTVEFFVDGAAAGTRTVASVPAGAGRYESMAVIQVPLSLAKGTHTFRARIVSADGATVLDCSVEEERYVP